MLPKCRNNISAQSGSELISLFAAMNPMLNARLLGVAISLATALSLWSQSPGPLRRVPNTTLRMPWSDY